MSARMFSKRQPSRCLLPAAPTTLFDTLAVECVPYDVSEKRGAARAATRALPRSPRPVMLIGAARCVPVSPKRCLHQPLLFLSQSRATEPTGRSTHSPRFFPR